MGGVRGETFGILKGVIQPRNHPVERHGQLFQFVAGFGDRQAIAQVQLGNLLGRARDAFHGPHLLREPVNLEVRRPQNAGSE
jgi:hypothetical protein